MLRCMLGAHRCARPQASAHVPTCASEPLDGLFGDRVLRWRPCLVRQGVAVGQVACSSEGCDRWKSCRNRVAGMCCRDGPCTTFGGINNQKGRRHTSSTARNRRLCGRMNIVVGRLLRTNSLEHKTPMELLPAAQALTTTRSDQGTLGHWCDSHHHGHPWQGVHMRHGLMGSRDNQRVGDGRDTLLVEARLGGAQREQPQHAHLARLPQLLWIGG